MILFKLPKCMPKLPAAASLLNFLYTLFKLSTCSVVLVPDIAVGQLLFAFLFLLFLECVFICSVYMSIFSAVYIMFQ